MRENNGCARRRLKHTQWMGKTFCWINFALFSFQWIPVLTVVSSCVCHLSFQQQLQVHQLSQLQGLALPMTPLPLGLTPPSLPAVTSSSGLLSLSSILASHSHAQAQLAKEDKVREGAERDQREEDGDKSDWWEETLKRGAAWHSEWSLGGGERG